MVSLSLFLESDAQITLLFAIAAVGTALYVLSQKMLIQHMDTGNMNFPMIVIISNSSVLYTILWSYLFFREPITLYILGGALAFVIGLVILNLPSKRQINSYTFKSKLIE